MPMPKRLTLDFNPRARVGRDDYVLRRLAEVIQFQSTRPRGARRRFCLFAFDILQISIHAPAWGATLLWLARRLKSNDFNPRARVGRDMAVA